MARADDTNTEPPTPKRPRLTSLPSERRSRLGLKRILINTVTSQLDRVLDAIVFLVLVPFVLKLVGTEEYGLWSLVWAVVSLFALVDLGFGTSVVKYVADARGRRDVERLRRVVCTLFWVFITQSTLLGLIMLSLSVRFSQIFSIPAELEMTGRFVFVVVGSGFLLKLPLAMFRGVLIGDQKLWLANAYRMGSNIVYFVAVLWILPQSPHLRTFAWLNWIATLVPSALLTIHCVATMKGEISVHPRHFEWTILREIWGFSFYLMLIHVAALVGSRVDTFVIQSVLPLTAVAVYAVAMRVSDQARTFCLQLTRTLTPVVAELHSAGAEDRLRMLWLKGTRFTVGFAAPLLLGCAVLARPLVHAWVGDEFEGAVLPLQLLLMAGLASLIHGNSQSQLSMRGEQRFLALAMLLGQCLNLGFSMGLVTRYGLSGVALATLVGPLVTDVCLVQPRLQARFAVTLWSFYRQTVLPSVMPAFVMVAFQHGLRSAWRVDTLLEIAALELLNVAVFWSAFWWFGFDADERKYVGQRVRGGLQRAVAR